MDFIMQAILQALRNMLSQAAPSVVPPGTSLLFEWFGDLHAARTWHMNGPNPISHGEIEAYARLNLWSMKPRHVAIIRAMDGVYIEHYYAKRGGVSGEKTIQKPTGDISPSLFDAVFG